MAQESCCFAGPRRGFSFSAGKSSKLREPITVVVTGVAGQIGYSLIPMIANGEFFGPDQRVVIKGLDLDFPATRDNMKAMRYEAMDGNFPLLEKIEMYVDEADAFQNADYAVLLGSWPAKADGPGSKKETIEKNVMIFKTMGQALERYSKKDCKVIIFGTPASTNALICSEYARSLPKSNFTAVTRLQHNRALGQVACRANVAPDAVSNLIIWGGATTECPDPFVDIDHCMVNEQRLLDILPGEKHAKWLAETLPAEVKNRGREVMAARKASAALSAARAICDHVRLLHGGSRSGEMVSFGIWTDSRPYDLSPGMFFSMPVRCQGRGKFTIVSNLSLSSTTRDQLRKMQADLLSEKRVVHSVIDEQ